MLNARNTKVVELSSDERKIIQINAWYNMAATLSQVFINVYLYEFTKSLVIMSIYTIIRIAMFPFFFALGGKLSTKIKFSYTLSAGLLFIIGSLVVVLFGTDLIRMNNNAVYIVALLTGIGEGLFWFSVNSCHQLVPRENVRGIYLAQIGIFNNITALIAPIISSLIIVNSENDTSGYINIFKIVVLVYIFIVFIALGLKVNKSKSYYPLKNVFDFHDKFWKIAMLIVFFYGIRDSLTLTLSGLLIYNATGGSGNVYSKLLVLFSLLAIISFRVLALRLQNANMMKYFKLGSILTALGSLILVYCSNLFGAIVFGIFNAIASAFYGNPFTEILMKTISTYSVETHVSRVIAKETALSIGRCLGMGFIVLFYFVFPQNNIYLYISVTICSICPFIVYYLTTKLINNKNILES